MKKVLLIIAILLFAATVQAHVMENLYYSAWTNSYYPRNADAPDYCGWWSAIAICSISPDPQVVRVTVYAKGKAYPGEITLENYGIYTAHTNELMEYMGYDPTPCIGASSIRVEHTPYTFSTFYTHNCEHSYSQ